MGQRGGDQVAAAGQDDRCGLRVAQQGHARAPRLRASQPRGEARDALLTDVAPGDERREEQQQRSECEEHGHARQRLPRNDEGRADGPPLGTTSVSRSGDYFEHFEVVVAVLLVPSE